MPPIRMRGDGRKAKNPKKTLARLLSYLKPYRGTMILVILCILISSLATALSSYSLDPLINNYIRPLAGTESPNFTPLVRFLVLMGAIYALGIVSSFLYNYLMVKVGQGMQKTIRDDMFRHMQRLPIRYFDTHTDAKIRKAFAEEIPGTTKLIIAQRVASVQDADLILVMDGGHIVATGKHDDLLQTSHIYREVYESQTKGVE